MNEDNMFLPDLLFYKDSPQKKTHLLIHFKIILHFLQNQKNK